MTILFAADLAYLPGPILAAVDPAQVVAGVGAILLMAIALAAVVHGTRTRIRRLEPDAIAVLVTYVVLLAALWRAAGVTVPTMRSAHARPVRGRSTGLLVAASLATDPALGLTVTDAADRLARFGPNELVERGRKPAWRLFAEQFTNTMIVVLMIAALVTALIGDLKDTVVIMAIVVLNGVIGFIQEFRAEQAMAALKQMTSPTSRVLRGGEVVVVPAAELVPGDVVRLETGDIVAADMRLTESAALRINEAALTGESEPAAKVIGCPSRRHGRADGRSAEHGLQGHRGDLRTGLGRRGDDRHGDGAGTDRRPAPGA